MSQGQSVTMKVGEIELIIPKRGIRKFGMKPKGSRVEKEK